MSKKKVKPVKYNIKDVVIRVPGPIYQSGEINGVHLISFNGLNLPIQDQGRNLWAFSPEGEFLWKIQASPMLTEDFPDIWVAFEMGPKGKIKVINAREDEYLVDDKNGDLYLLNGIKLPRVKMATELTELEKKGLWPPKK